jgi:hypothetical protein
LSANNFLGHALRQKLKPYLTRVEMELCTVSWEYNQAKPRLGMQLPQLGNEKKKKKKKEKKKKEKRRMLKRARTRSCVVNLGTP